MDYIGKYENLSSDLKIISKSIDIDLNNIPLLNYNNVRNTYSDMYDFYKKRCYTNPKVVQFVRNKYRKDFKNFDYGMNTLRVESVTEISDMMKELLGSFI